MKNQLLSGLAVVALAGLTGCESASPGTGTVVGSTAAGAGLGAAIGALAGGTGETAAIGALAGAAAGAIAGVSANEINKGNTAFPTAERDRRNPNYAISPFDGSRLWVGDAPEGARLRDPSGRVFVVMGGDYPVARRTSHHSSYVINPHDGSRTFVGDLEPGTTVRDRKGRIFIVGR